MNEKTIIAGAVTVATLTLFIIFSAQLSNDGESHENDVGKNETGASQNIVSLEPFISLKTAKNHLGKSSYDIIFELSNVQNEAFIFMGKYEDDAEYSGIAPDRIYRLQSGKKYLLKLSVNMFRRDQDWICSVQCEMSSGAMLTSFNSEYYSCKKVKFEEETLMLKMGNNSWGFVYRMPITECETVEYYWIAFSKDLASLKENIAISSASPMWNWNGIQSL